MIFQNKNQFDSIFYFQNSKFKKVYLSKLKSNRFELGIKWNLENNKKYQKMVLYLYCKKKTEK